MAIFRVRNSWKAEVFIDGRRVKTKCFGRKSDAERWHDETRARLRNEPYELQVLTYTFEDLIRKFSDAHLPGVRPETAKRYNLDVSKRIAPYFRYRKLSSITSEMIEEFKLSISAEMRSGKSINNCLHTLRLMLNKAVRWKMLSRSPYMVDSIKIPRNHAYQWWDKKEYISEFLYEARIRSKYYPAFVVGLDTGMREGEITGLDVSDVEFDRLRIRCWRQWNDKAKCFGPRKFDVVSYIYFEKDSRLHEALRTAVGDRIAGPVFITSTGARLTNRRLYHYFQNVIRHCKVPRIPFHALRHTFASWFMIEFGDAWALAQILGHTGSRMIEKTYGHHSPNHRGKILGLTDGLTHKSLTFLSVVPSSN
jgi:integrase